MPLHNLKNVYYTFISSHPAKSGSVIVSRALVTLVPLHNPWLVHSNWLRFIFRAEVHYGPICSWKGSILHTRKMEVCKSCTMIFLCMLWSPYFSCARVSTQTACSATTGILVIASITYVGQQNSMLLMQLRFVNKPGRRMGIRNSWLVNSMRKGTTSVVPGTGCLMNICYSSHFWSDSSG